MSLGIRGKINGSYLILVVVFIVNGIITIVTLSKSKKLSDYITRVSDPTQYKLESFKELLIRSKMYATNWAFLRTDQQDKDALNYLQVREYPGLKVGLNDLYTRLHDQKMADSVNTIFIEFEQLIRIEKGMMFSLQKFTDYDDPVKKMQAEQAIEDEIIPRTARLMDKLMRVSAYENEAKLKEFTLWETYSERLRFFITILAISIIIIAIILSRYFSLIVISPISKIRNIIFDMGKGITRKIESKVYRDEIGDMILSVNHLSQKLEETARFAEETGRKNFALSYTPLSDEDTLGKALLTMRENLRTSDEEISNANRLYAFISAINQTIVQAKDEQTLFNESCRIAVTIGKFELACIDMVDEANKKLNLLSQNNATPVAIELFSSVEYPEKGIIATIAKTGKPYVINEYVKEAEENFWRQYAFAKEFRSAIILPLKKSGKTKYLLSLFSQQINVFDEDELKLLEETAANISFALDVFEKDKHRKKMEEDVMHSESSLKQAQAIAHFGNWEFDFSTGIVLWSDEACRIYGIPAGNNIQSFDAWVSHIHPEDLAHVLKVTGEGQRTLSSSAFHHRIVRKDGAVRYIYSQAQFVFNKEGEPTGLHGVAHDETDTIEAAKALGQSQANLRLIVDLIPQPIFVRDIYGKFIFTNENFANLYGLNPEEMIHKSLGEINCTESVADSFLEQDREVLFSGENKMIPEYPFTDHSGTTHFFNAVKVPFTVAGTNEKAVLGIITDVSEQKKVEEERTKMITDIMQRNKDLEQFSYIVSHNLRAPLANISGLTGVMQIIGFDKDDEKELVEQLAISVKKLDTVIRDLNYILQLKETDSKKKENVVFSELLSDIKLSMDTAICKEGACINSDFSAIDEMVTFKAYLYSIFLNLISNSIKYRQPGIQPVIEIISSKLNNKIQFIFKDNGMGIDLEKRGDQVFGLYKRFHSHVEGKGMGLYMVKTQVEALGGKITISSEVNKGTEFRIEF